MLLTFLLRLFSNDKAKDTKYSLLRKTSHKKKLKHLKLKSK